MIGQRDAVQNALRRPTAAAIGVEIVGADTATARSVDFKVDGVDGANGGTLRYTALSGGASMLYLIPTRVGAC